METKTENTTLYLELLEHLYLLPREAYTERDQALDQMLALLDIMTEPERKVSQQRHAVVRNRRRGTYTNEEPEEVTDE